MGKKKNKKNMVLNIILISIIIPVLLFIVNFVNGYRGAGVLIPFFIFSLISTFIIMSLSLMISEKKINITFLISVFVMSIIFQFSLYMWIFSGEAYKDTTILLMLLLSFLRGGLISSVSYLLFGGDD